MRKRFSFVLTVAVLISAVSLATALCAAPQQGGAAPPPPSHFKVMSSAYSDGSMIPTQYSCAVPNGITPPLAWSDPPAATQSFAIILHDPEGAPGKNTGDVTHWILWNIPATSTSLPADVKPDSTPDGLAQGKNVRGINGYQPPCPPPGAVPHHYTLEMYALDAKLDLPAGSTRDQLLMAMNGHVIGKAAYVGMFGR